MRVRLPPPCLQRLAQRWGLTDGKSVEQTEADLKLLFPQSLWKELHLQVSGTPSPRRPQLPLPASSQATMRPGSACLIDCTILSQLSPFSVVCPNNHLLLLQIIFFGREKCPAQRHDPILCPVCSWAAVPPFNKPGVSPLKPGKSKAAAAGGSGKAATAGGGGKAAAAIAAAAAPAKRSRRSSADKS